MKYKVEPCKLVNVEAGTLAKVSDDVEMYVEAEQVTQELFDEAESPPEVNLLVLSFENPVTNELLPPIALGVEDCKTLVADILVGLMYGGDKLAECLYESIPVFLEKFKEDGLICIASFCSKHSKTEITLYNDEDEDTEPFARSYGKLSGALECGSSVWVKFGESERIEIGIPHDEEFEYYELDEDDDAFELDYL